MDIAYNEEKRNFYVTVFTYISILPVVCDESSLFSTGKQLIVPPIELLKSDYMCTCWFFVKYVFNIKWRGATKQTNLPKAENANKQS